jgi:cation diffusion facilitator family transporter
MAQLIDLFLPKRLRTGVVQERTERAFFGRLEGWASIVVNTILFLSKLVVGIVVNSLALIADAFHSLSDVFTSIVVLVGYSLSEKPGDREHPYGHQRIEYVATLVIAILLAVVGFEFIRQGFQRFQRPEPIKSSWVVLLFIVVTIVIKYGLGNYSRRIGQLIKSQALEADAFHHYSDAVSSILVLVAVLGSGLGYPQLDGLASFLVGAILIYGGFKIARDSADTLIGQPPSPDTIARIRAICRRVEHVLNAHDIIVHTYGEKLFISVHVEIDQRNSSIQAHAISDAVEAALVSELNALATIHLDPVDTSSDVIKKVKNELDIIISRYPEIKEYHDVRIIDKPDHRLILFDLVPVMPGKLTCLPGSACDNIKKQLAENFPDYQIEISFDPIYIFN